MRAARRITERDRLILTLLWEHRVLTTTQLCELAFDNLTTARHRLSVLHELRLVDRFQPRSEASLSTFHYVLDHLGSYLVVADRGENPDELDWRKENALAVSSSRRLAHTVGVNGLFVRLAAHARRHSAADLHLWWSEKRVTAWIDEQTAGWPAVASDGPHGRVWRPAPRPMPDGYGVWRDDAATVAFAVEYDRGTETLGRLTGKLGGYVELAWLFGHPPWTLFAFTSSRRETNARLALADAPVPVATASDLDDPAGPVWLPVHHDPTARVRLAHLTTRTTPGPAVRPLLDALAEPGSRAARGRLSRAESSGLAPPHPADPDGREAQRYGFV
jgi:hypothetical protein